VKAELATSHDMLADPAYFAGQGCVDPNSVVLIGQSAGGVRSVATDSREPPGDVGFVNFSGGRGSRSSGLNCSPEHLVDTTGHLGGTNDPQYLDLRFGRGLFRVQAFRALYIWLLMMRPGAALDSTVLTLSDTVFSRAPANRDVRGRLSIIFLCLVGRQ
jgi:hypothetical protein